MFFEKFGGIFFGEIFLQSKIYDHFSSSKNPVGFFVKWFENFYISVPSSDFLQTERIFRHNGAAFKTKQGHLINAVNVMDFKIFISET